MNEIMEMKTDMVSKLVSLLIEKNPELSMEQALNEVFNSDTYKKLMDEHTQLYFQSARYVFAFLEQELNTGRMA